MPGQNYIISSSWSISRTISMNEVEFPMPKSSLLVSIKPVLTVQLMKNAPTMFSTNSLPVQLPQNGIISTLKMFLITPSLPLPVATVFHLVLSVTTPSLWLTCEWQCAHYGRSHVSDPMTLVHPIHSTNAVSNLRSNLYSSLISQLGKQWNMLPIMI